MGHITCADGHIGDRADTDMNVDPQHANARARVLYGAGDIDVRVDTDVDVDAHVPSSVHLPHMHMAHTRPHIDRSGRSHATSGTWCHHTHTERGWQ